MTQIETENNPVLDAIGKRRSIRHFTEKPVSREHLMQILKAGMMAPSGLNNQPWRFAIVQDKGLQEKIAQLTHYSAIILSAQTLLPVFIDKNAMYHAVKDHQAIGACLQNMLLAAHSLGLGAVWLGEILKNAEKLRELLALPENLELMAVLAIGFPEKTPTTYNRKPLSALIIFDK